MKVASNVKPKKRKVVGMTQTRREGDVVKPGSKSTTVMTASTPASHTKKVYTPTKIETGDKRYGAVGKGTDKEMNRLLNEAQAKKRDVTDFGTTGRTKNKTYKAGTTTYESTGPKLTTTTKVDPQIKKLEFDRKPQYETTKASSTGSSAGKLKARAQVRGGSTKGDHPSTKYGHGTTKKVVIRRVVKGKVPKSK